MSSVLGVIPARWASSRFPGKALAPLGGKPMVQHVWERSSRARLIQRVIVATDDQRIASAVAGFGGEAMLTAADHPCGSDRVAEVVRRVECDIVVNIQGDEPTIDPAAIDAAVQPLLDDSGVDVATLAAPLSSEEHRRDPNVVKVVCDRAGNALYFSRLPVPHGPGQALHHLGLYAFRSAYLLQFASWSPTPLERSERLEQLRVLEQGGKMRVVLVPAASPGVDTPEDLERLTSGLES